MHGPEELDPGAAAVERARREISVDDFGTGYSSLSNLKRFPVDTLKIDRSFVHGLGQDEQDAAIVRSIIALARALKLSVIGEGIETVAQRLQLRAFGCDRGQGYLFARPLTAQNLALLLAAESIDSVSEAA
jgi:EAL domain-containing protein (putative c-di-GMP-specific phosphodiesterase class I)